MREPQIIPPGAAGGTDSARGKVPGGLAGKALPVACPMGVAASPGPFARVVIAGGVVARARRQRWRAARMRLAQVGGGISSGVGGGACRPRTRQRAPATVPATLRAAIAEVDETIPVDSFGQPRPRWTLTWLEGRPTAELDTGVIVELGPDGEAVVRHDEDDDFA